MSEGLFNENEVTHSSPKAASGGTTVFQVRWTAPAEPSGVYLEAFALYANGNASVSGDGAGYATVTAAFGCSGGGALYYPDFDDDGYARDVGLGPPLRSCSKPVGYAERLGDCNDSDQTIHPAVRICSNRSRRQPSTVQALELAL